MDFTKKILPGDKLDISLTNAENDAVYKSMFSDLDFRENVGDYYAGFCRQDSSAPGGRAV